MSITCPKINLWAFSSMSSTVVVLVWNPIACLHSSTLGFCILNQLESQIIHLEMHMRLKKTQKCKEGCTWKSNFIDHN